MSRLALKAIQAAAGNAGGIPWDISTAVFNGKPKNWLYLGDVEALPYGVSFKSDGYKMYITGQGSAKISEYNLSTAWDVNTATLLQQADLSTQTTSPRDIFFKEDGTKVYVPEGTNDTVLEYDLTTAWDISSLSYVQSVSVASQETIPNGVFFKSDGTAMYVVGQSTDTVYQYTLSTAWDVSTASYASKSFSVASQENAPGGIFFKSDGTKMFIAGTQGDDVNEYALSTAWDVSTASYTTNFAFSVFTKNNQGLFFKSDGTSVFTVGTLPDAVSRYDLSTAWDVSTASFTAPTTNYYDVSSQVGNGQGIFLKDDGTEMYVCDSGSDAIYQYSLSTAYEISSASYLQSFSVSSQETSPRDLFFKSDGTKMYVTGTVGDDVNQYSLSTAWDISTASFEKLKSVSTWETAPTGIAFKSDGTKMYIVGSNGDDVNEFDLTTAWDVGAISFVQNFSFASQTTIPNSIRFKPDGTKMYTINTSTVPNQILEYDLSTAWDVSSSSYLQNFSVVDIPSTSGIFFKDNGRKVYVTFATNKTVLSYDL
jgi:DNA-binding beta-propeller fold protein YncE